MNLPYSLTQAQLDYMSYAKPKFTSQKLNWSGNAIRKFLTGKESLASFSTEDVNLTFDILDNCRASHSYPLNTFYSTLKRRAYKVSSATLVSQRIKRLISIANKLCERKNMKLTQMQDIGGCRAVLPSLAKVYALRNVYLDKPLIHTFIGEKDYISQPQATGYRSIHLKYRFTGTGRTEPWDRQKIEIQLRTKLQHRWATAVESAGTFNKEALKSNRGSQEWLRFFSLMASVFAIREECVTVPGTPSTLDELYDEIRKLNKEYHIARAFLSYNAIIPHIEKQKKARYFLVTLDPIKLEVSVKKFEKKQSQEANKAYTKAESSLPKDTSIQVVLVSVASIQALKHAYPNYFLDTKDFMRDVSEIVVSSK